AGLGVATRLKAGAGEGSPGFGTPLARDPPPAPASTGPTLDPDFERRIAEFPAELRPTLQQAIARLVDYQDRRYAERYLERLSPFARDPQLARAGPRPPAASLTHGAR